MKITKKANRVEDPNDKLRVANQKGTPISRNTVVATLLVWSVISVVYNSVLWLIFDCIPPLCDQASINSDQIFSESNIPFRALYFGGEFIVSTIFAIQIVWLFQNKVSISRYIKRINNHHPIVFKDRVFCALCCTVFAFSYRAIEQTIRVYEGRFSTLVKQEQSGLFTYMVGFLLCFVMLLLLLPLFTKLLLGTLTATRKTLKGIAITLVALIPVGILLRVFAPNYDTVLIVSFLGMVSAVCITFYHFFAFLRGGIWDKSESLNQYMKRLNKMTVEELLLEEERLKTVYGEFTQPMAWQSERREKAFEDWDEVKHISPTPVTYEQKWTDGSTTQKWGWDDPAGDAKFKLNFEEEQLDEIASNSEYVDMKILILDKHLSNLDNILNIGLTE